MLGIMILGQDFRDSLGTAMSVIMDPVVVILGADNLHIVLFIMASITALYASLIQKYTIDWGSYAKHPGKDEGISERVQGSSAFQ